MKKFSMFLFVAFLATMLVACGKDDEKPANPAVLTNPTAPYILYWDGARMQVGRWGTVTQENILYAQFGSLVAVTGGDGDEFDMTDVKFNPTMTIAFDVWTDIPVFTDADWDNGVENISDENYHNAANVALGKGDICKLAGLTAEQVKAGIIDNKRFRLPTHSDNIDFLNLPTKSYTSNYWYFDTELAFWGQNGTMNGGWFPIPGDREADSGRNIRNTDPAGFLPAAGRRQPFDVILEEGEVLEEGLLYAFDVAGYSWSSTLWDRDYVSPWRLNFAPDEWEDRVAYIGPSYHVAENGCAIRCVPQ
jgi:hypothetical protein